MQVLWHTCRPLPAQSSDAAAMSAAVQYTTRSTSHHVWRAEKARRALLPARRCIPSPTANRLALPALHPFADCESLGLAGSLCSDCGLWIGLAVPEPEPWFG
eukprot:s2640_g13.t1